MEEPVQKMPPLKDIPTVLITSPPKSPPKSEGSMTTEVSNLLSQAVLEVSGCGSQQSSPRRPTTAVVPNISTMQKPEGLLPPANTSSQASIDDGGSLPRRYHCQHFSKLLPFLEATVPVHLNGLS